LQKREATTGRILWSHFIVPKDSSSAILESSFEIHERPDKTIHLHLNRSPKITNTTPPPSNTYYHLDSNGIFIKGKKSY